MNKHNTNGQDIEKNEVSDMQLYEKYRLKQHVAELFKYA